MKALCLIAFLFFSSRLFSQTHNEVWAKVMITKKISHHFNISGEYQHRTQSNYLIPDKALLHNPLSNLYRLWLNYKLKNNWEIVAAPIAYFNNHDITSVSGLTKQTNEIRIAVGANKTYLIKKLVNKNRVMYEIRFINFNTSKTIAQQRLRFQNSLIIPITKISDNKLNVNIQNEVMVKNQLGITSFDQERLAAILQVKAKKMEYNFGYQYCMQKGATSSIYKNQFLIGTTVNL